MRRKFLAAVLVIACAAAALLYTRPEIIRNLTGAALPSQSAVTLDDIPDFSDEPYVEINDNIPYFSNEDMTTDSFELYGGLDLLQRCTQAYACVSTDTMPAEERDKIGNIKPSGWQTIRYDFIDGKYLYNRCHLIGFQLTGENANRRNLITGTRYLNVKGMLPHENIVASYVRETGNHVLYRVTPIFTDDELLCRGVEIEALSVEDNGAGVCFNVYCYNVQPGVEIDYSDGSSEEENK